MSITGPDPGRVLSVQSHVVSGYVATFPLQMLGYDVDVINTVQFSNHTGYGHTDGHKTTAEQLSSVFSGLRVNGLMGHARVLSGYIPGAQALSVVQEEVAKLVGKLGSGAESDDGVIYLLDPVMGDIGVGLYVSQDVVPIYKDMLRLATIITPNQFEVEILSETKITSLQTLHAALAKLHEHVPHVVLSSIVLPTALLESLSARPPPPPRAYTDLLPSASPAWYDPGLTPGADTLVCLASSLTPNGIETYAFALPTVRGYFSGVGDLFSALVLGLYKPAPAPSRAPTPTSVSSSAPPLVQAVSRALLIVQQILLRTHVWTLDVAQSGAATPRPLREGERPPPGSVIPSDAELDAAVPHPGDPKRKARRMRLRELRIVQERHVITADNQGWQGIRLDWDDILSSRTEQTL